MTTSKFNMFWQPILLHAPLRFVQHSIAVEHPIASESLPDTHVHALFCPFVNEFVESKQLFWTFATHHYYDPFEPVQPQDAILCIAASPSSPASSSSSNGQPVHAGLMWTKWGCRRVSMPSAMVDSMAFGESPKERLFGLINSLCIPGADTHVHAAVGSASEAYGSLRKRLARSHERFLAKSDGAPAERTASAAAAAAAGWWEPEPEPFQRELSEFEA